jgi:HEAT repeat protein
MPNSSPDTDAADPLPNEQDKDGIAATIRTELNQDDGIDYDGLARRFGPSALDALRTVLRDPSPQIAAGAASLAGMLEGGSGFPVVEDAARNDESLVRAAAVVTLPTLVEKAERIVDGLLEDEDVAVRGHALRSAARIGTARLRERIAEVADRDPCRDVRELARRLLREPPTPAGRVA